VNRYERGEGFIAKNRKQSRVCRLTYSGGAKTGPPTSSQIFEISGRNELSQPKFPYYEVGKLGTILGWGVGGGVFCVRVCLRVRQVRVGTSS
jgi:hypothetical protein